MRGVAGAERHQVVVTGMPYSLANRRMALVALRIDDAAAGVDQRAVGLRQHRVKALARLIAAGGCSSTLASRRR